VTRPLRVLLVEDSRVVRAYVEGVLRQSDLELLPAACDGPTGVALATTARPDVVLMDLELPGLDGVACIREIMARAPCPIVVLSAYLDAPERDRTFESLDAGAVEVMSKPAGLDAATIAAFRERLLRTVRLMAQARVVRRAALGSARAEPRIVASPRRHGLVVIGASTGGPIALCEVLRRIPPPFAVPVVVAQHIVAGFEAGLVEWLGTTGHVVRLARAGGLTVTQAREACVVDSMPVAARALWASHAELSIDALVGLLVQLANDPTSAAGRPVTSA
jgi:two-component system chemotaxis response regulator CheB